KIRLSPTTSLRTLRNFPMQANGGEMLRLAAILATDAGVQIVATIHDAVLIEAGEDQIEHHVFLTQAAMRKASEMTLDGSPLRTDAHIIRPMERFPEERGADMWRRIMAALETPVPTWDPHPSQLDTPTRPNLGPLPVPL